MSAGREIPPSLRATLPVAVVGAALAASVGICLGFPCFTTGIRYGMWLDRCPATDLRLDVSAEVNGLLRGTESGYVQVRPGARWMSTGGRDAIPESGNLRRGFSVDAVLLDDADQRLAEVHLAIAEARHALGQLPNAVAATQLAQSLARSVRDPGLESRVASELGSQLRKQGSLESAEDQCRLAIQRAEESGDQCLLPRPLYQLGGILWTKGDLEGAEQMWRRSLQIAQQVGDERAQGNGYNGLAILAICRGQSMDARRWFEQSATLFERLGMLAPLVIARVNLIELYLNSGILRKALALSDRTLSQAEEASHPQGIALGRGWRACGLLALGRATEAEREADAAWSEVRGLANREDEALVLGSRIQVCFARDRWEEALTIIEQLLGVLEIYDHEGIGPEVAAWRALALCQLERREEAERALRELPSAREPWPHIQIRADLSLGRSLLALERPSEARTALQRALAASEANGYRYFQLIAHTRLVRAVEDDRIRSRHARVASGLARSLAANLPRDDAERFLKAHDEPSSRS